MKTVLYDLFCKIEKYAFYSLLFFLAISNALVEASAVFLLVGFLGRKIIKPDFGFVKSPPNVFLLLFLLFNALSLLNSAEFFHTGLRTFLGKYLQYLGIYLIAQDNLSSQGVAKNAIKFFLFGASLAVFSGLSQYFFGVEFLRNRAIASINSGQLAVTSSFNHYNAFGGYLVTVLALAVTWLVKYRRFGLEPLVLLIFSLFCSMTIILTFSRGSWIAVFLALLFSCVFSKNLKWVLPVILLIFIMFLFRPFHERILFIFKSGGDSDRFKYWAMAFKMIKAHPFFGVGVGTFMANFAKTSPGIFPYLQPSYAHNCYLQIWAEAGIFALLSFACFVFQLFSRGIREFLNSQDFILLGLLSAMGGFLVHSFFEVNFYSLRLAVLFWAFAGLISGARPSLNPKEE